MHHQTDGDGRLFSIMTIILDIAFGLPCIIILLRPVEPVMAKSRDPYLC
jgi:hypothetical protein